MSPARRTATRKRPRAEAGANGARAADSEPPPPLEADEGVRTFLDAIERGEPWYPALLDVIARWVTPEEEADGVLYRYLIGGEAFDWLRLAERLLDAADDTVPAAEAERLLFGGEPPEVHDGSEEAFARAIGHEKFRAHLNFQYGVTVEEVLLLQAELELVKARNLDGPRSTQPDVAAYERVYGRSLPELLIEYRADTGETLPRRVLQSQLRAFTYWCSKYRFRLAEPARVASDTRKALALLSRLEAERVPRALRRPEADDREVIEGGARGPRRRRRVRAR
ncbi:MAG: hypothetical protein OXI03_10400 [Chloroflexota bacterium]|nr:hypothetical protein [Chloroflexota bacterium]